MAVMQIANASTTSMASGRLGAPSVITRRARKPLRSALGTTLEKQEFDAQYVSRLAEGDPATERHFTAYFGEFLRIKLRRRDWSTSDAEDICQKTFLRVWQTLRQKGGLKQPESLGAFVNSVCNNIVHESYRERVRNPSVDAAEHEPVDRAIDMDGALIAQERKRMVQRVLADLPESDRKILRMIFWEETPREVICQQMNVDRDYLRVLLHRALARFKGLATEHRALAAER